MKLGMVGLGKMGGNMAERLRRAGHEVVGFDRDPKASDVADLAELVERARRRRPRVVWVMVPAGDADRADRRRSSPALAGRGRRRHRRRQLELRRLDPARARSWPSKGIGFVDAARAAACGASRTATASWSAAPTSDVAEVAADLRRARARRTASPTSARSAPGTTRRWSTTASSTG